jgi:hypothetical protein
MHTINRFDSFRNFSFVKRVKSETYSCLQVHFGCMLPWYSRAVSVPCGMQNERPSASSTVLINGP